jgi:hypothetical protein
MQWSGNLRFSSDSYVLFDCVAINKHLVWLIQLTDVLPYDVRGVLEGINMLILISPNERASDS